VDGSAGKSHGSGQLIAQKSYVNAPEEVVKMSMTGTFKYAQNEEPRPLPDFNVFYRYAANFPWLSHAAWFISQMYRWGQLEQPANILQTAASIYRPDLYRQAAKALGVPYPTIDVKKEGINAATLDAQGSHQSDCDGAGSLLRRRAVFDPAKTGRVRHRLCSEKSEGRAGSIAQGQRLNGGGNRDEQSHCPVHHAPAC
jgi:hypothetical protein